MRLLPPLLLQHRLEIRERRVRRGRLHLRLPTARPRRGFELLLVLVIVAIQAKELPVAAVRRIVVVVVIAMMDGQLAQVLASELPGAAPADPRIDLERLFAIALPTLQGGAASVGDYAIE